MKFWAFVLLFILGVALGIAGPLLGPRYFGEYLPKFVLTKGEDVEGKVVRKQMEKDKLLMTISTDQGAILATFNQKVAEINLLIEEGDAVTFRLRGYDPFVTNPPVVKVRKEHRSLESNPINPARQDQPSHLNQPEKPDPPEQPPASPKTEAPLSPSSE